MWKSQWRMGEKQSSRTLPQDANSSTAGPADTDGAEIPNKHNDLKDATMK